MPVYMDSCGYSSFVIEGDNGIMRNLVAGRDEFSAGWLDWSLKNLLHIGWIIPEDGSPDGIVLALD
jgi:hypothetical protein